MEVPNNLIGENNQNTNEAMNEQSSDNSMAETACDSANDIKLKVPLPVILFLGTIIIVSVISLIKFPGILKDYRTFKTAKERVEYGETSQVLNDLHILTEKYPESLPIIIRTIEQSLENGYYEYAAYVHDTYMVGKKLTNAEYQWVETYTSWLDKYFYTTDQVNAIINQALDYSDEETIRQEIIYNLIGLLFDENINHAVVNYFLGLYEYNTEYAINYFMDCYRDDPECYDVRVQLGNRYRRAGDYENALLYIYEALAKDKRDAGALRALSIIHMLKGDFAEGLKAAQEAYNYNPDGNYIRETYMIALNFNGNNKEAEAIKNEIIELNGQLDLDTLSLLNGDLTLEEYYLDWEVYAW
ncbi:hypothetical protein DFR55_1431 [Herbinix hemicellulosilytica]|uniref:Uncharacterized protein n=1 Tax=Herbinix hemicellulosilytica TaxID=1564487 RepID=A0A0H5SK55_HERHM|nr:hypothetical protein [Herbinix hemicellulosilytica]RBP56709.1 hypothetical protein DFR55_1431 [Herbinix hemicellulosilytica]CRZ35485.1 hypothetical protein HHT355_2296 [Herbinix hemicellulosilytica]